MSNWTAFKVIVYIIISDVTFELKRFLNCIDLLINIFKIKINVLIKILID